MNDDELWYIQFVKYTYFDEQQKKGGRQSGTWKFSKCVNVSYIQKYGELLS